MNAIYGKNWLNTKVLTLLLLIPMLISCTGESGSFVEGFVFEDNNQDGQLDTSDSPKAGVRIYADLNDDSQFDEGEPYTLTNHQGRYLLELPFSETNEIINIRQQLSFGWRNSVVGKNNQSEALVLKKPEPFTNIAEYPFTLFVTGGITGPNTGQPCSAVLISDRWGITAGHCGLVDMASNLTNAQATFGLSQALNTLQDISASIVPISRAIRHPDFQFNRAANLEAFLEEFGDIALGEVIGDITLFELAQPIDLGASGLASIALAEERSTVQTLSTHIGYGSINLDFSTVGIIDETHLFIQGTDYCEDNEERPFNAETQICAAIVEGGVGTCVGDSGGPLVVKNASETTWQLEGITSYGSDTTCGTDTAADSPSFFMSVPFYKNWIETNAIERSAAVAIEVLPGEIYRNNHFANVTTTREFTQDILKQRYQLTQVSSQVSSDNVLQITSTVIDEDLSGRNFQCAYSLFDTNIIDRVVECTAGNTTTTFSDLDLGIYLPALAVSLTDNDPDAAERTSAPIIVGDIEQIDVSGTFITQAGEPQSVISDEYNLSINDASIGAVIIRGMSNESGLLFFLLDRDILEANEAEADENNDSLPSPFISFQFNSVPGEPVELIFVPEEGRNYTLQVQPFPNSPQLDGTEIPYQLSLLNGVSVELLSK